MSAILTDDDLLELSGLRQGAAQAKFLQRAYGLNVPRRPDGRVRVTWEAINQAKAELAQRPYVDLSYQVITEQPRAWADTPLGRYQATERERSDSFDRETQACMPTPAEQAEIDAKQRVRTKESAAANIRHHAAKRRAFKLQRTPSWADMEAIKVIYRQARMLSTGTGVPHHVDHKVPLQGKQVSGLHVHQNLQILTGSENSKKSNRFEVNHE